MNTKRLYVDTRTSPLLRAAKAGLLLAAVATAGCTAGAISNSDGSPLPTITSGYVEIFPETGVPYKIALTQHAPDLNGSWTFSFDPYSAETSTNGGYIPAGEYWIQLGLNEPGRLPDGTTYVSVERVKIAYDSTCTDAYTGANVYCALLSLVICNKGLNAPNCAAGNVTNGSVTTVPMAVQ